MKIRLFTLLLFLSPLISFTQLEIPNGDFETWDYYNTWTLDPEHWMVQNFQLATHVYPDSLAYEGDLAMKVYPFTFFEAQPGAASVQIPASAIPPSLDFAVKCNIDEEVEVDTVRVMVHFFNTPEGEGWIEVYHHEWISDVSIPDWQWVSIELNQIEPVMDLCVVTVVAGYGEFFLDGGFNTWISVDAMGFDTANSLSELGHRTPEVKLKYIPFSTELIVQGLENDEWLREYAVFDLSGRCMHRSRQKQETWNATPGIYSYRLMTDKGAYSGKLYIP